MFDDEKIIILLRDIITDPTRQTFNEINILLESLKQSELLHVAKRIDLIKYTKKLFTEFKESELISELGKVLNKLFDVYPVEVLINENDDLLIDALEHPSDDIREVALKQILRISQATSCQNSLINNVPLMKTLISQISSDNLTVATYPTKVFLNFSKKPTLITKLFAPELNESFQELLGKGTIVKFRVYEAITQLACISLPILETISRLKYLELLIEELNSRDELSSLNALEILTDLTLTQHGGDYLDNTLMPKAVLKKFENCLENTVFANQFLLPGFLKFFGRLSLVSPERLISAYPEALGHILTVIENPNLELRKIGIECLSMFGSTVEGKQCLAALNPPFEGTMARLGNLVKLGDPAHKDDILIGLSFLLKSHENAQFLEQHQSKWYKALDADFTAILFSLCKLPFHQSKLSALTLTEHLARQGWGQKEIAQQPGFLEFLLDRNTLSQDYALKYRVVNAIVQSTSGKDVFSEEVFNRMVKFCKDDHKYSEPSVAIEKV